MHSLDPLFHALATQHLVVTPNQHLSHTLLARFFKAHPVPIQARPLCLPFPSFLKTCFDHLIKQHAFHAHPMLLTPFQALTLWKQTCLQHAPHFSCELMEQAFSAWQQCKTWQIPLDDPLFSLTPQTQQFQVWAQHFENTLSAQAWLTDTQIIAYLSPFSLRFPYQHVIFACFDDFNPAQHHLQTYLTQQGVSVETFDLPCHTPLTYCAAFKDESAERQAIVSWLQTKLAEHTTPVALIVPRLAQQAPFLKRWLRAHFPQLQPAFSFGQPLQDYPLIAHAIECLTLSADTVSIQQLQFLLRSVFIKGASQEHAERLALLARLPMQATFELADCLTLLTPTCPILADCLTTMPTPPHHASPTQWVAYFVKRLNAFGLPDPACNSVTYQVFQRFHACLEQFQSLALLLPTLSASLALQLFTQLTKQTLFQPEQSLDAALHVLGPFEAAGIPYTESWFMGLTDSQFPGHVAPTPWIPLPLQHRHHLPHTDGLHDLALTTHRLQRLRSATTLFVLSYPQKTLYVTHRPHPFMSSFPPLPSMPKVATPVAFQWETYVDPTHLPLHASEHRPRNTALLSDQAKCPFRAFASQRLMADPSPFDGDFFSPKHRGIRLHHALEYVWRTLTTQQTLQSQSPLEITTLLEKATQQANNGDAPLPQPAVIQRLEQERLMRLIQASFDWEASKPPFNIAGLEKKYTLSLGPLTFHVRLDRLDRLNATETWITDYKTTCPTPLPWQTDLPLEPQLLIYALVDNTISGLIFHELKKGKTTIKGLSTRPHPFLETITQETWNAKREQWRQQLNTLALAFHQGSCSPSPTHAALCQSCAFRALCRHAS